jgi:hypothetical protein
MSDVHLRLLRRVAAVRREAARLGASTATADGSVERREQLDEASARANAQLTAATDRRRRRSRGRRDGEGRRAPDSG